jgi:hypothetical protein
MRFLLLEGLLEEDSNVDGGLMFSGNSDESMAIFFARCWVVYRAFGGRYRSMLGPSA